MNIPDKIKVGGHVIDIKFANTKNIDTAGYYDTYYNLIRIRKDEDTPESNISEVFLHEILEVIRAKNNLDIDHTYLTVLSENLFQVLRDNKLKFYED